MNPGRWGWTGGTGTSAYVDPLRNTVAVLLTQRQLTDARDVPADFWSAAASTSR
jgi:CubicO group peptidase (beta-lactamase class C family)